MERRGGRRREKKGGGGIWRSDLRREKRVNKDENNEIKIIIIIKIKTDRQ